MCGAVGKDIPRLDGIDKVTGRTRYIDDIDIPGCWFGAVVRSPIPYGKIRKIRFDPSFDWSRVVICTHKDIPGKNCTVFLMEDQPILAEDIVCHVGEAVVLIAAPTKRLAEEARDCVKVEYEEMGPVLSIEEARAKKAVIWGKDNIQSKYRIVKGDIERGFKEADHIVEGEYRTGFHEHIYIETQGMAAIPRDDGGLTVVGSLQCPFYVLKTLKKVLGEDETRINVLQAAVGGAFGGKEDYPSLLGSYVALLSKKSGFPVKIVYNREEDILFTTKRHPSIVTHKTGVKNDGTITAMEIDIEFDGGAYSTLSPVVLSRAVIHSAGPYKCENVIARASCYATNKVPSGAFRGFGAPQVFFALESHIDKVAETIGMSPCEFRLRNCVRVGDTLSTTQLLKESVAAEDCLKKAVSASNFKNKWKSHKLAYERARARKHEGMGCEPRTTSRGIGLSLYMHGGAFTGSGEAIMKAEAGLRLDPGGRVAILTGCTDMGQGAHTVLPQIVADALGMPVGLVRCEVPDTALVPDSGPTVASRTTMIIGGVLEKCAVKLKAAIEAFSVERFGRVIRFEKAADEYFKERGELKVIERYELPPGIRWDAERHLGDAYPVYSWAADVAEVTVDMETFEVTVDKMTTVVDVGKAVNPTLVEGQIEGGTLQALGWCLMEDSAYENGRPMSSRLQTYIIPTIKDMPEWETKIIEKPFSAGPHGAKGVGELPLDGGAPAIANAIYNATGIRITELPITPEKLFEAFVSHAKAVHKNIKL